MKRTYMKPTMRVVKIQQQHHILVGSPDGQSYGVYRGAGNQVDSEDDVW